MKKRFNFNLNARLRKIISVFCVCILISSMIEYLIGFVEVEGLELSPLEPENENLFIFEAEGTKDSNENFNGYICYNVNQIVEDGNASNNYAIVPDFNVNPNLFNYPINSIAPDETFKYYIRAKSITCSSIIVGWNDIYSEGEESFLLTNEWKGYV